MLILQCNPNMRFDQAEKWANVLVKCIKPIGEPEFTLNGDTGNFIMLSFLVTLQFFLCSCLLYYLGVQLPILLICT